MSWGLWFQETLGPGGGVGTFSWVTGRLLLSMLPDVFLRSRYGVCLRLFGHLLNENTCFIYLLVGFVILLILKD